MLSRFKFRRLSAKHVTNEMAAYRYLRGEASSLFHWNSKITSCFKKGDVKNARKLFEEMPHKNVVSWNCMISGYIKNGMILEARRTFDSMPVKNVVSWTAMLSGYAKNGRLEEARVLFDAVEQRNEVCWNSMISGYVSIGRIEEARMLFDAMPLKNDVSFATMIGGCFRHRDVGEAEGLFNVASSKSVLVCNAMLAGYSELKDAVRSYDFFMRMVERDVASWTCLIECFVRVGEMVKARKLFEDMPRKDVVAWTVMIRGYLEHKELEMAKELFDKMPYRDIVAWNTMLGGIVQNGKLEDTLDMFMRMPQRNTVSWNLMLRGYLQQGDVTITRKFFERIPLKDVTSWNTMISGFQNEGALDLYVRMLQDRFKPDQGTLTSVITACGMLGMRGWGNAMHGFVVKMNYENDHSVMSSLISMYSRCGFVNDASLVFKTIQNHDTVTWNAMILAQAHHYSAKKALNLFQDMINVGCEPDNVTFLIILNACAHSGLVSEGCKYLKLMEMWNLIPNPDHYACMVDLLGRSGLLIEAFEMINQWLVDLPSYAWEALFNACRIHENYELCDILAQKILRYKLADVGMFVLQSNIYSLRGMWKDAAHTRRKLKQYKVKKELGCSWIDVNGKVSCFSCNDKSHIRSRDIYKEMDNLAILIDEVGADIR